MVSRKGVHKVRNNTLKQDSENVNRDYFIEQRYLECGTFLNMEQLKKTGRSLKEATGESIESELPRKFFDIGEI